MAKLVKEFICEHTGIKSIFTYQDDISRGVESVELIYPKEYLDEFNKEVRRQSNLPKTKQMYLNPKTGKEVSYFRAKTLGIVK
jgi:hypothetical protein